jgi:ATP-dependent DNA helicase RecQ
MEGDVGVIVATNAFGMGVDKPDIRFVYHADVSESLDAYYQEIGRAGRDGKPAEAVLFYRTGNIGALKYRAGSGKVDTRQLEDVVSKLAEEEGPMSPDELAHETSLSTRKLINTIHKLEQVGAAEQLSSGEIQLATEDAPEEIAEAAAEQQEEQKELRKHRLEKMEGYAECRTCRREYLLRYFGDEYEGPCGNCDNCEAGGMGSKAR